MGLQLFPSSFGMPGEATRTAGGCTALRPAACSGRAPRAALQGCAGPLEPSQQIYGWGDEHTPRALLPRQLGFLRNALIASSAINDPRGQSTPGRVLLPGPQGCCSRSAPGNVAPSSYTAEPHPRPPRPRPPCPRPPIPLPRDGVHAGGWWCRPRAASAPCP